MSNGGALSKALHLLSLPMMSLQGHNVARQCMTWRTMSRTMSHNSVTCYNCSEAPVDCQRAFPDRRAWQHATDKGSEGTGQQCCPLPLCPQALQRAQPSSTPANAAIPTPDPHGNLQKLIVQKRNVWSQHRLWWWVKRRLQNGQMTSLFPASKPDITLLMSLGFYWCYHQIWFWGLSS